MGSSEKKKYCCATYARGCPFTTTKAPFDCHVGDATGWSSSKRHWCCAAMGLDCSKPEAVVSNATGTVVSTKDSDIEEGEEEEDRGCENLCTLEGKSESCAVRVKYAAVSVFMKHAQACSMAHSLIVEQCAVCLSCSIDSVKCTEPDQDSLKPRQPTAESSSTIYDCDADVKNWKNQWSVNKALWCCTHAKRGCPSTLV